MPPFIIYSLPRSRTAWLSAFLTYGEWKCYHEVAMRLRSLEDIKQLFSLTNVGIVETAAIQARPIIKYLCPEIREVVILRPVQEAIESMLRTPTYDLATWDVDKMNRVLGRSDKELRKIANSENVLTIDFDEIGTEEGCRKIFEYCLPYEFDKIWWMNAKDQNIQIDMKEFFTYYVSNREAIEKFKKQLKTDLRNLRKENLITRKI